MHVESTTTVAPALKALLEKFIDYAGIFPPAGLPLDIALANFIKYGWEDYSWMLRWIVVNETDLKLVPSGMDGRLSVISEGDESRAATIESKSIVSGAQHPVYCEVAVSKLADLEPVKKAECFAKIRTGGLKAEAIPSSADLAKFILTCAELKLAFKATAGLHHPIRSEQNLTYEADAPRAVMHGFLNVVMAAAFAWNGEKDIEAIISETDPSAFSFAETARWRDKTLTEAQIRDARQNFIHSVGSCSFEEPVQELKNLGLL